MDFEFFIVAVNIICKYQQRIYFLIKFTNYLKKQLYENLSLIF